MRSPLKELVPEGPYQYNCAFYKYLSTTLNPTYSLTHSLLNVDCAWHLMSTVSEYLCVCLESVYLLGTLYLLVFHSLIRWRSHLSYEAWYSWYKCMLMFSLRIDTDEGEFITTRRRWNRYSFVKSLPKILTLSSCTAWDSCRSVRGAGLG